MPLANDITIREAEPGELIEAMELVKTTFMKDVAPLFNEQGQKEFLEYVTQIPLRSRIDDIHTLLLALHRDKIIGVLELRNACHISLFFVDPLNQGKGIGKKLFAHTKPLIDKNRKRITVNASPNARNAYVKLGFNQISEETETDGIRYYKMAYPLK